MRNKISRYEENQVDRFLYDLYLLWGGNLDEDMCIGEGWIVYLEGREKYQYDIGDTVFRLVHQLRNRCKKELKNQIW